MLIIAFWVVVLVKEARPQAVAWFPPLPPAVTVREVAVRVSPAVGQRGVDVTKSMFREPMMQMCGWVMVDLMPILACMVRRFFWWRVR